MVGVRQQRAFHTDQDLRGRQLTPQEREKLLRPYLPDSPARSKPTQSQKKLGILFHHKQRVRPAIRHLIHYLIFSIAHLLFAVYIRTRQIYHAVYNQALAIMYYHHRTPELIKRDVKGLGRVPRHLSVLLEMAEDGGKKDGLDTLLNDACEVAAWTASAGIPMLSIYEKTGTLKATLPHLHRRISLTLNSYFGAASPSKPTFSLRASNLPSYSPPHSPQPSISNGTNGEDDGVAPSPHLTILLIDASDGRQTLVDLTKTLAEMSQRGKLSPSDVSMDLIDAEISESVMGEPDLLVIFGGRVVLDGYPPWQVRLSEIFYAQDHEGGTGYQIFLRALYKFAKAEFRVGR